MLLITNFIYMKTLINNIGITGDMHREYVDDLQFMTDTIAEADGILKKIKMEGQKAGLIVNDDKTEQLQLDYESWKEGKHALYLGAVIGNAKTAVSSNIDKCRSVHAQLYEKLFNCNIKVEYKIKLKQLYYMD